MYLKKPSAASQCRPVNGAAPVVHAAQPPAPPSAPGTSGGCTTSPEVVRPDQMSLIACTCLGVKQLAGSCPAWHVSTAGSNLHLRGSSITPSWMPSIVSQAAAVALPRMAVLLAGI